MAQAVRHVGVTEGYDAWAETYNADGNPLIHRSVEEACGAVQQLDVRGKVVADIGTGTGRHLVSLLERGAALAISLDGSAGMLARAEMSVKQVHHVPASRSRLVQHDLLQTLWPLETGSCDVVLCSLVLEQMTPNATSHILPRSRQNLSGFRKCVFDDRPTPFTQLSKHTGAIYGSRREKGDRWDSAHQPYI
eukprot:m.290385 g.290385  ORF g.290385 m.290385 type:complete len:192 (-) comp16228_c0_seq9:1712-2287(-)